jgi:hypothetical protein
MTALAERAVRRLPEERSELGPKEIRGLFRQLQDVLTRPGPKALRSPTKPRKQKREFRQERLEVPQADPLHRTVREVIVESILRPLESRD